MAAPRCEERTCVHAKSLQWCPTLFDTMDCSLPGSSVYWIQQEYCSGLPCPLPEDLPDLGIELSSLVSCFSRQVLSTSTALEAPKERTDCQT